MPFADLVLRNGTIVTMDPARPRAAALAARGGRIVATGEPADVVALAGRTTRVVDLAGGLAVPGFIEAHGHLTGLGRARRTLDLTRARDWDAVVALAARVAAGRPRGSWILGWGWHQDKWDRPPEPSVAGYPVHEALTRALPDHPAILKHAAGAHMGIVNAEALRRAGIDRRRPDPPGGEIVRDARGEPTGVLRENAYALVLDAHEASRTPEARRADGRAEVEAAAAECLRKGITSFQDAGSTFDDLGVFRAMAEEGRLPVRLYAMIHEPNAVLRERLADARWIGVGGGHLTVRAIKRFVDGALGSHGAWLLAPYDDRPGSTGENTDPVPVIEETAALALAHGFQVAVHAIGDRGNRETLDLFERALARRPRDASPRFRIEHAQILDPADAPRFARLSVIASIQAVHAVSDGPWLAARLGERRTAERASLWRTLIDSGAVVANGTDAPIEDPDPVASFDAAVTRRMADGRAFYPDERMSRAQALHAMTAGAAYAAFEEDVKGRLAPGLYADVTVLDRDLLTVPDEEIRQARVTHTIVGGRVLYASDGSA